jgi:hypothetical protein
VAQSPEHGLAEFMTPLPQSLQKVLWYDHVSMTDLDWAECIHSTSPFTADQLQELKATTGWQPQTYPQTAEELRPRFEQILQRCGPAGWRRYCDNARAARKADADAHAPMPRGNPGRPRKDALAQEAAELQQRGMNSPQIAAELNKRHGKDTTTPAAIPKLIKRFLARTKSTA